MRHVGQEFGFVFRKQGHLLGLFFERFARLFDLAVFFLDLDVLLLEQAGLFLQLEGLPFQRRVGKFKRLLPIGELRGLSLEFLGEFLRLLEQLLGAQVGDHHVQHHADALAELVKENLMDFAERMEGRQFDHGPDVSFKENGQDDYVERRSFTQARAYLNVIGRDLGEQDALFLQRALADQSLAQPEAVGHALALAIGVGGGQFQHRGSAIAVHEKKGPVMRRNQRRQLRHDQARNRIQILLPLHHAREARQVGLEPVLLGVFARGLAQVADHLVDRVA